MDDNTSERTKIYQMLGVVNYVEQKVIAHHRKHDDLPKMAILGRLEWELLGEKATDEFSIAGVPCIPDLTTPQGVRLS